MTKSDILPIRVGVAGCSGRMGRQLTDAILESIEFRLVSASVRPGNAFAQRDVGELLGRPKQGIVLTDDPNKLIADADVIIDFSDTEAASVHVLVASRKQVPIVVCVTGFTSSQLSLLREAGRSNAVLLAPNTSLSVALLVKLVEVASATLGPGWGAGILDIHHRAKKDSPSGTALALQAALERGFAGQKSAAGEGQGGSNIQNVEVASIRAGSVVGDHTVYLCGSGERIELIHKAQNRAVFVEGALNAARWLRGRPPGFYTMSDLIS